MRDAPPPSTGRRTGRSSTDGASWHPPRSRADPIRARRRRARVGRGRSSALRGRSPRARGSSGSRRDRAGSPRPSTIARIPACRQDVTWGDIDRNRGCDNPRGQVRFRRVRLSDPRQGLEVLCPSFGVWRTLGGLRSGINGSRLGNEPGLGVLDYQLTRNSWVVTHRLSRCAFQSGTPNLF
jgi:hypothetical protein